MNEQYQKSLTKLELDKVLALLADHASSPAAKERCLAVQPLDDAEDIRLLRNREELSYDAVVPLNGEHE